MDIAPSGDHADPVEDVRTIEIELEKFSSNLATRERWLVLNKLDLVDADERETRSRDIIKRLGWQGPVFSISAIQGEGCRELSFRVMEYLEQQSQVTSDP